MRTSTWLMLLAAVVPRAAAAAESCPAPLVEVRRFGQPGAVHLALTDCAGRPSPAARAALSGLAQPGPAESDATSAEFRALNPGLLVRLQRIARRFPGRAVEIVSGYRPHARPHSRHRTGDALDLRLAGVDPAVLSAFARTLTATGVGYYPKSGFVHVDVREQSFYWVDQSGPGEAPVYTRRELGQLATEPDERAAGAAPAASPASSTHPSARSPSRAPAAPEPELEQLSRRALAVIGQANAPSDAKARDRASRRRR